MDIHPVTADELEDVWALHLESRNDLLQRMGRTPPVRPEPIASDLRLLHRTDPRGFFCAREGGELRGMAAAIVRGSIWFLSSFWVAPKEQGRGIGRALLDHAIAYGRERGAQVSSVWASLDPRAQARYLAAGLEPRWPIYRIEGDAAAATRLGMIAPEEGIEERLDPEEAAVMEAPHWGARRTEEHAMWAGEAQAIGLRRDGRLAAFAYLRGREYVGPACGETPQDLALVVAATCTRAPGHVLARVPGVAFELLRTASASGFHLSDLAVYMSSGPVGNQDRRLPSGPFLF